MGAQQELETQTCHQINWGGGTVGNQRNFSRGGIQFMSRYKIIK